MFVLSDPHAGSGKCDPGQYDGQFHQHLPRGGNKRTVEGKKKEKKTTLFVLIAKTLLTYIFNLVPLSHTSGGLSNSPASSHCGWC